MEILRKTPKILRDRTGSIPLLGKQLAVGYLLPTTAAPEEGFEAMREAQLSNSDHVH
jgi:hypothetical protein